MSECYHREPEESHQSSRERVGGGEGTEREWGDRERVGGTEREWGGGQREGE